MNHEKRISDLEKGTSKGFSTNVDQQGNFNIIIEEGESAPWEQDIGMLHLRLDEFNKKLNDTLTSTVLNAKQGNNASDVIKVTELENKINSLEKELFETKSLLMKLQTFNMETSTTLLRHTNLFDQITKEKERENKYNSNNSSEEVVSAPITVSGWLSSSDNNNDDEDGREELGLNSLEVGTALDEIDQQVENPTFSSES